MSRALTWLLLGAAPPDPKVTEAPLWRALTAPPPPPTETYEPRALPRILTGTWGQSPGTRAKRRWKRAVRGCQRRNHPRSHT
jgi:hypothetical protein